MNAPAPAAAPVPAAYLVTAWTQRPEDEHRLLSSLLACFLRNPMIKPDDLERHPRRGRTCPSTSTSASRPAQERSLADVWSALGGELKPSLDVVVTAPIVVDSQRLHRAAVLAGPVDRDLVDRRRQRGRRKRAAAARRWRPPTIEPARRARPGRRTPARRPCRRLAIRVRGRPDADDRARPAMSRAPRRRAAAPPPSRGSRGDPSLALPVRPPVARRGARPRRRGPPARRRPRPGRPVPRPVHLGRAGGRRCSPAPASAARRTRGVDDGGRATPARRLEARRRRGRGGRRATSGCARLARAFGLEPVDVELLLVALAPDLDPRFERLYGYLHDDVSRRRASVGLALELRGAGSGVASGAEPRPARAARRRWSPAGSLLVEDADRPFLTRSLRVPDRVTAHLLGDDSPDPVDRGRCSSTSVAVDDRRGRRRSRAALDAGHPARLRPRAARRVRALARADGARRGSAGRSLAARPRAARRRATTRATIAAAASREARLRGAGLVVGPVETLVERGAAAVRAFAELPGAGRSWSAAAPGTRLVARAAARRSTRPVPDDRRSATSCGSARSTATRPSGFDPAVVTLAFRLDAGADRPRGRGRPARVDGRRRAPDDGRRRLRRRARPERGRPRAAGAADRAGRRLGRPRAARRSSRRSCAS